MSRFLFVCKRRPQQRDLLQRPYGRFHHLPRLLAAMGHDVHLALVSHGGDEAGAVRMGGFDVSTRDIRRAGPVGAVRDLVRTARAFAPDWVVGCSDAWVGCLAAQVARRTRTPLALDAYDNFEAYMPWNLPLHALWRHAVRRADVVTAAGPQLAGLLQGHRRGGRPVDVLPMAADPDFVPRDRTACRRALGLPDDLPLLGYVGSWSQTRGSHLIVDMFRRVRMQRPDAQLVLSGRPPPEVVEEPGVIAVGYLPDALLPTLIAALDVACIVTADTAFGRYSHPAKLCEAMACGVPVVASATDAVRWMLGDREAHLARVGDAGAHAERVLALLAAPAADYGVLPRWPEQAAMLAALLGDAARRAL